MSVERSEDRMGAGWNRRYGGPACSCPELRTPQARPRDRAPFSLRVVAVAVQDDELEVHRALKAGFPRPCMRLQVHRFVSWLGQVLGWPLTSLGRA